MSARKKLLEQIPADPVDVLAHLLPGGACLLGLFHQLPQLAMQLPAGWDRHPLWLALLFAAAWVLGLLIAQVSHVLNRPYDLWAKRRRARHDDPKRKQVRFVAGPALGPNDSAYAFAKTALNRSEHKDLLLPAVRLEAISKLFRTICMLALMGFAWAIYIAQPWGVVAGFAGLAFLCWRIFIEHRWAASQAIYQGYLIVKKQIQA